jgi:thiol-disulfide isomerase/thioredoxin
MKNLTLLLLAFFGAQTLCAQKLDLKKISEFSVETNETRDVKVGDRKPEQKIEKYTFQFKNLGETADGYKLGCTMVRANIRHDYSSLFVFNSDSIRKTLTSHSSFLEPMFFLEKPFTVYVSSNGKVNKIEGIKELMRQAETKWHIEESTMQYFNRDTEQEITATIKRIFLELPEQKISYQSTWDNKAAGVNYKVTAIAGSLLTIVGTGSDTLTAKYTLNDNNGLLEDAKTHWTKVIDSIRWDETIDYTQKLIYDKHIAASVDTAWGNMAATLSWNGLLRPGIDRRVDSAVTFGYFKQYDPIYKDDPFYLKQKVTLVNQMRLKDNDVYKSLLLKTPHRYLTEVDLSNKMNAVTESDIDQLYDFVKFRAKSESLDSWIQGSLVFDFLGGKRGTEEQQVKFSMSQGATEQKARQYFMERERASANKLALLGLLYNEKDAALKQKIVPLYYWYTASQNKNNTAILTKTAAQFKKLTNADLIAGNGGRYGVLLYKILNDAGLTEEADAVLDKTLGDFEKMLVDDTTYNSGKPRAVYYGKAVENILMAGNYLKYKQLAKIDSAKALPYLAKAAQYSPLEVVGYSSPGYADRTLFQMFLQVEDNYRKAYIEKLFDMGDTEKGLKIFATQINANMGSLAEMEKIYQQRFPDKKFSDFIINNTIAAWQPAPDWTAKDVDGKEYKLADYKGKWLILDYWATWCPPCREEMPEVDAFNKELVAGKHPGITLLGVANGDKEKDIRHYFEATKLSIPTVLEDNGLYKYGVKAIPTKCLVAPNGKFLMLNHREDWQKVIVKLNQLYAASN